MSRVVVLNACDPWVSQCAGTLRCLLQWRQMMLIMSWLLVAATRKLGCIKHLSWPLQPWNGGANIPLKGILQCAKNFITMRHLLQGNSRTLYSSSWPL